MPKNSKAYLITLLILISLTVLITPFKTPLGVVNIALLYLLPILFSATKWGTGPALFAAALGALTFDFFFVPPFLSFTVEDLRYLLSFAIFILAGLITGNLSTKLKKEIVYSRQRETRVASLYNLSRDIAAVSDLDTVLNSVVLYIADTVEGQVILLLPDENKQLILKASSGIANNFQKEMNIITWVFEHGKRAGRDTDNMTEAAGMYLPLYVEQGIQGVLGIYSVNPGIGHEQIQLLEAYARLTALAIHRIKLTEQAREAETFAESERLRTALFNSLSHDLRTPLASIIGAVTSLLQEDNVYTPAARQDLLQTIQQGAVRMHRFVNNLLDMARLESGMLKLKKEWCDLQDIIGVATNRFGELLRNRTVRIKVAENLPLVFVDYILIEQVFVNLLDNALKYSVQDSEILITAQRTKDNIEITVADQGPKIPAEDLAKIFDKFYRLKSPLQVSGTGLGLAICKGIIEAHGGNIWAENNPAGGVKIKFTLVINEELPDKMPLIEEGDRNGR